MGYVDTGNGINKYDDNENNKFKINNFPSDGLPNSFNVNKTANYTLIIEYQPHIWFSQGLTISTVSLAAILVASIPARKKFIIKLADIKGKTSR